MDNNFIEKGKKAEIGETHIWNNVPMIKTVNGWVPVNKHEKTKKIEENKHNVKSNKFDSLKIKKEKLESFAKKEKDSTLKNVVNKSRDKNLVSVALNELNERKKKEILSDTSFLKFDNYDDFMRDLYFQQYKDDAEKLSKEEISSLEEYQYLEGYAINRYLRCPNVESYFNEKYGKNSNNALSEEEEEEYQNMKKNIKNVDSAFSKFKLKHNIETKRIISSRVDIFNKFKEGDIFSDKGFVSSTIDKDALFNFGDTKKDIILTIRLLKGMNCIPMNSINLNSGDFNDESEFLTPRDTKFKVILKDENNYIIEAQNDK